MKTIPDLLLGELRQVVERLIHLGGEGAHLRDGHLALLSADTHAAHHQSAQLSHIISSHPANTSCNQV